MESHSKRKKIRKLITFFFTLFFSVSMTILMWSVELRVGFHNTNTIKKSILSSTYIKSSEQYFADETIKLVTDYNMPQYVADKIIEKADIYNRVHSKTETFYKNKSIIYNYDDVSEIALIYIKPYSDSGILNSEKKDEFISKLNGICEETLNDEFFEDYAKINKKYSIIIIIAFEASLLSCILLTILIWNLYKYKHRALRGIIAGFSIASVVNLVSLVFILIMKSKFVSDKLSGYKLAFMNSYYKAGCNAFIFGCILSVVIIFALYFLYRHFKYNS